MTTTSNRDEVIRLGKSLIQHGPCNDRIYIMHLDHSDMPGILDELESLALKCSYGKIFGKIHARFWNDFNAEGYMTEAIVPKLFGAEEDGAFMSKFIDPHRGTMDDAKVVMSVLDTALSKSGATYEIPRAGDYEIDICKSSDAKELAELYGNIFISYPFPVDDPDYIEKNMENGVVYFGAWQDGVLAAASAAETWPSDHNVEMTDFATYPKHRGRNLASILLVEMEKAMRKKKLRTAFSIARASSYSMNITFSKLGYAFAGTLVSNTNIGGRTESMNVWYRRL